MTKRQGVGEKNKQDPEINDQEVFFCLFGFFLAFPVILDDLI